MKSKGALMARRRHDQVDDLIQITPNQVVAYNLAEARALRRWTQEEAAAELEQYLGARWSKATFSAAERSIDGRRVRQFTADEIVAFSRCFRVPIGFFFMPTRPSQSETPLRLKSDENPWGGVTLAELIDVIFGAPGDDDVMSDRLERYLKEIDMGDLTEAQDRLAWRAEGALNAVVMKELARFDDWRKALTELASQLRSWQNAAKAAAVREKLDRDASDG
jgi:transcriptional regulator with XRE-family HTH domain